MTRLRCLLLFVLAALCVTDSVVAKGLTDPALRERQRVLLESALAALAPQRPGVPDLYVVGFGGDSTEDVFRNETVYLDTLMTQRFGARGRVLTLINHDDSLSLTPRPLATLENLRTALAGIGKTMDPEQDVLLLFMTMHGTPQHQLFVQMAANDYLDLIDPKELRAALDDAGIRNRVLVISACYSGGFVPTLKNDDTLILTASHRNRPSFGCGADSDATYFGRAWLIEALNETTDFVAAFEAAKTRISEREDAEGFRPSRPQIAIGKQILPHLQAWQSQLVPGPKVAFTVPAAAQNPTATVDKTAKRKDEKASKSKK
ncbi:MAG: C13 family peptidase [Lysobacteraceae bacterium]